MIAEHVFALLCILCTSGLVFHVGNVLLTPFSVKHRIISSLNLKKSEHLTHFINEKIKSLRS